MQKVLVLGSTGMLGYACRVVLEKSGDLEVISTARTRKDGSIEFDIFRHDLISLIQNTKPDWILNCIGVIKPHIDEKSSESIYRAIEVNSLFPAKLANATQKPIIQIATDCVFSGKKGQYHEYDLHDALDVYGKSKSLGEVPSENTIHLRASIIGPELGRSTSLLEWFRNQGRNEKISGYINHYWNGITTYHFAKIALGIIQNDFRCLPKTHIVPSNSMTKFDLLCELSKAYSRSDVVIEEVQSSNEIDRTLSTLNSNLSSTLWNLAGYDEIPSIAQMVQEQASAQN